MYSVCFHECICVFGKLMSSCRGSEDVAVKLLLLFTRTLTDLLKQQGAEGSSEENAAATSPSQGRANGVSARMMRSRSGQSHARTQTHYTSCCRSFVSFKSRKESNSTDV